MSSAGDALSPHKSALMHSNSPLSSWDLDRAYDAAASGGSSGTGRIVPSAGPATPRWVGITYWGHLLTGSPG
jgi:hypothetical protein